MSLLGRYLRVVEEGELPPRVDDWPDNAREHLEERIAHMHDGDRSSAEAIRKAAEASVRQRRREEANWNLQHLEPLRPDRAAVAPCVVPDEANGDEHVAG